MIWSKKCLHLINSIDLSKILNNPFTSSKHSHHEKNNEYDFKLNEVKGVSVINDKGEEVPLRKLSSGEQNLIILYYKLAFSTDMRTVLLIDEPENSLHMAWVSQMLEDYQKMAEELKCQIIIATHSPAFINEHWDISCDLYTNNEENNHAEFAECK